MGILNILVRVHGVPILFGNRGILGLEKIELVLDSPKTLLALVQSVPFCLELGIFTKQAIDVNLTVGDASEDRAHQGLLYPIRERLVQFVLNCEWNIIYQSLQQRDQ